MPSGTVAFLFTDVEKSTALWERHQQEMAAALEVHDGVIRDAIEAEDGVVFSTAGDAFAAAFHTPAAAVNAALAAQRGLTSVTWPEGAEIRVRMGLHAGVAHERNGDYFGPAVNRAARLMGLAVGGEVLASLAVEQLTRGQLQAEVSFRDVGVHELRGLDEPERVFHLVAPGLALAPVGLARRAAKGNVPVPPTTFVGREKELKRLMADLQDRRLITLAGPGGIGKTRLAIEAAHAAGHRFSDGVWFCELAPVEASGVLPTVAKALGILLRTSADQLDEVVEAVAGRDILVVLDNCEHVIDAAAGFAERVLTSTSSVRLLCTSREVLGVAGEQVWRVSGLGDAAVKLFYERATASDPAFQIDERDAAAVVEVCRRLDEIPLAIELAAARTRALSVVDIASRLDERFRLLRSSGRGQTERHQTLRNTVQWSYDLLGDGERALFERLSVFAGGFSLDAVTEVCGDDGALDSIEVLDIVESLVDKSMVFRASSAIGTRYAMLETLRQFGAERLQEQQSAATWASRHASYFARLVLDEEARLHTGEEPSAWQALNEDWDNIRAAFEHGLVSADADVIATIPSALGLFGAFALHIEVGNWASRAIASGRLVGHPLELDCRGAWALSAYWLGGRYAEAGEAVRAAADRAVEGRGTLALAAFFVAQAAADKTAAESHTRRWVTQPGLTVEARMLALGARALYGTWFADPDVVPGPLLAELGELAAASGSPSLLAFAAWHHGLVLVGNSPEEGLAAFERAANHLAPLGSTHLIRLGCLSWVAVAAVQSGDHAKALRTSREILVEGIELRFHAVVLQGLRTAALTLARLGSASVAAQLLGATEATGHHSPSMADLVAQAEALVDRVLGPAAAPHRLEGARLTITAAAEVAIEAIDRALRPEDLGVVSVPIKP